MRRALTTLVIALAVAPAAQAATPRPVVKSVSPLRASVGEVMTVTGANFKAGDATNVVVFVNRAGRVVYVRAGNATAESIAIRLPSKIERLLEVRNGVKVATRFRVKVISSRMGKLARGALSKPTIGPDVGGDCDKDGTPNPVDSDDDNDFLYDEEEAKARTNPCVADSDGDRLLDGWEYLSALDLNRSALPYPGKKPYPNALYADAEVDYDGDGLPAWAEHALWWLGERKRPLSYSDGDQDTQPEPVLPGTNVWDRDFNLQLEDDERDFDKDGIANINEFGDIRFEPWEGYPGTVRTDFLDADTDGDGLLDGMDDQDHDDISNLDEIYAGTWVMNPCDPNPSRVCPRWRVFDSDPSRPAHLCLSITVWNEGDIAWYKEPTPEELETIKNPPADTEQTDESKPCSTWAPSG